MGCGNTSNIPLLEEDAPRSLTSVSSFRESIRQIEFDLEAQRDRVKRYRSQSRDREAEAANMKVARLERKLADSRTDFSGAKKALKAARRSRSRSSSRGRPDAKPTTPRRLLIPTGNPRRLSAPGPRPSPDSLRDRDSPRGRNMDY